MHSKKIKIILLSLLLVVLLAVEACVTGIIYFVVNYSRIEKTAYTDEDFGIKEANINDTEETDEAEDSPITNVMFLGIDWEENRSDVMMILSINKETDNVKLISILRDSAVIVDGCDVFTRLGFAYKWGGAKLALKTVNQTYGTSLNKYIALGFESMITIIDILGGVEVNVQQAEVAEINSLSRQMGYWGNDAAAGDVVLNGTQAVAYARIRKCIQNDGEDVRAGRQQTVVKAMLGKIKKAPKATLLTIFSAITGSMETNLSDSEMLNYTLMDFENMQIESYTFPDSSDAKTWSGLVDTPDDYTCKYNALDPQQWLWVYDTAAAGVQIRELIGE